MAKTRYETEVQKQIKKKKNLHTMQDFSVVYLEPLLNNQYIVKTKQHHTSVFAFTYTAPFSIRTD